MSDAELLRGAQSLLDACRRRKLRLSLAESCTGGLIAAILTDVPGASDVLDSVFVSYSNSAKQTMLGVPAETLQHFGAVSAETARAMAEGAIARSTADLALAVTGIAGPGGGSAAKPVGLVFFSALKRGDSPTGREKRFGDLGRAEVRRRSAGVAFELLEEVVRKSG